MCLESLDMETNYYLQEEAGRVFLAVFLCLATIMEDQIKVEGWELEALEESFDCYKPTPEICWVCGVGTVTAVSRSAQKVPSIGAIHGQPIAALCTVISWLFQNERKKVLKPMH